MDDTNKNGFSSKKAKERKCEDYLSKGKGIKINFTLYIILTLLLTSYYVYKNITTALETNQINLIIYSILYFVILLVVTVFLPSYVARLFNKSKVILDNVEEVLDSNQEVPESPLKGLIENYKASIRIKSEKDDRAGHYFTHKDVGTGHDDQAVSTTGQVGNPFLIAFYRPDLPYLCNRVQLVEVIQAGTPDGAVRQLDDIADLAVIGSFLEPFIEGFKMRKAGVCFPDSCITITIYLIMDRESTFYDTVVPILIMVVLRHPATTDVALGKHIPVIEDDTGKTEDQDEEGENESHPFMVFFPEFSH